MAVLKMKRNASIRAMTRVNYDTISARYDGFRGVSAELARTISAEAGLYPGARVLDVGCGTGNIEAALAEMLHLEMVGVDMSFGMLTEAKAKVPRAKWIRADSACLPFSDESFDGVLMLYMLHHLVDLGSAISNAYNALREGRLVIVTASHRQIDKSFLSRFFPGYARIDKTRFPTIGAIVEAMNEAGFSEVTSRAIKVAKVTLDESYMEKVSNKHVSTFHIMDEEEFRVGLEKTKEYIRSHADEPPMDHMGTLISGTKVGKD